MPKGSPCSCGRCHVHVFCEVGAIEFGGGGGAGGGVACCRCIPKRICVNIWESAEEYCTLEPPASDPYGPAISKTLALQCDLASWSGSVTILAGQPDVDLEFYFEIDDYGDCWFVLESTQLNYISSGSVDDRLRVAVPGGWGVYDDRDVRAAICLNPEFEFPTVDLGRGITDCGVVRLTVEGADYQELPRLTSTVTYYDPDSCLSNGVCITITNSYGDVYKQIVYLDEYTNTWTMTVEGTYEYAIVTFEGTYSSEPTILSLVSSVGTGDAVQATCTCRAGMFAEWDFGVDGSVSISSVRGGCTDCHCFCRCLCVVYADDDNIIRTRLCWDEYNFNWVGTITLADYTEVTLTIALQCDQATNTTVIVLNDPFSDEVLEATVDCPDIAVSWTTERYPSIPVTITAECDNCGRCFEPNSSEPCGCSEFIAETLYATFSPGTAGTPPEPYPKSCLGATGTIILVFNEQTGMWHGSGTPFTGCESRVWLTLRCSVDAPTGKFTLGIGDSADNIVDFAEVEITCDPFSVTFTDVTLLTVATDVCCESSGEPGTVDYNIFDITVTE